MTDMTFSNFMRGQENELAYAACHRVAMDPTTAGRLNPIYLYGPAGCGKTHLLTAAAGMMSCRVKFLSAERFMFEFVQALRENRTHDFKTDVLDWDVLIVDDVQFIAGKTSTQAEFLTTIATVAASGGLVMVGADRPPADLENVDNKIASRLQGGLVIDIQPSGVQLRRKLLRRFIDEAGLHESLVDADEVVETLARKLKVSNRVLQGAITKLSATADLLGHIMDVGDVERTLSDVLRGADTPLTIRAIQDATCDIFGVDRNALLSPRRARAIARPRQAAMWLCKLLTNKSLPEIGRAFGGRDHTTVIHAVRKIETERAGDDELREKIDTIRLKLEGWEFGPREERAAVTPLGESPRIL